ncbi:MAG: C69 family dipeptidase [Candidatus Thorarchaeota archaeon]
MCDTIVALGKATKDGYTLFGKNSDRSPNESQLVEYHPSREYDSDAEVKCTYLRIPQAKRTNAVFLSRPHWMWGAEMGANEHGVVIGNEAVFSKEEVPQTGLLGMDLLRLGLERGNSARSAMDIIIELLEKHGQGGVYELGGVLTYHNSYIIADRKDAWVLETSTRRWAAERVESVRSISNGYSIGKKWDLASKDLVEHAIEQGWIDDKESFSFSEAYGNEMMRYITVCHPRISYTSEALREKDGGLEFQDMAQILRNHADGWRSWESELLPICQHTSHAHRDSSAGSQISELTTNDIHWFTGCSYPCLSLYWPFSFRNPHIFKDWNKGTEKYSSDSYWWRREVTNRMMSIKSTKDIEGMYAFIDETQMDIYRSAHSEFDKTSFQNSIDEFEKYSKQYTSEANDETDLNDDYRAHLSQINKDAEVP